MATYPYSISIRPQVKKRVGLFGGLITLALLTLSSSIRLLPLGYRQHYILLSDAAWGLIVLIALLLGVTRRRLPFSLPARLVKPWVILTSLVFIGTFVNLIYRLETLSFFSRELWGPTILFLGRYLLSFFVFGISYYWFQSRHHTRFAVRLLLWATVIVGLVPVLQLLKLLPDFWPKGITLPDWVHTGTFEAAGHLNVYMLFMMGLGLQIWLGRRRMASKRLLSFCLAATIAAQLISGRLSAWVAIFGFFLVLAVLLSTQTTGRRRTWGYRLLILAIAVSIFVLTQPALRSLLESDLDLADFEIVESGHIPFRVNVPLAYVQYVFESGNTFLNLILGFGFASSKTYISIYGGPSGERLLSGAHNQLVTWFFELGIPGLLVYCWFAIASIRLVFSGGRKVGASGWVLFATVLTLNLQSIAGSSLFIYSTLYGNSTFFYLAALALGVRLVEQEANALRELSTKDTEARDTSPNLQRVRFRSRV